jgi:hypothetical protein
MAIRETISSYLCDLIGQPAWGLKRTHGSIFFLEIGKPNNYGKTSHGIDRVHGDWHFLFELCKWSFRGPDGIRISSQNTPEDIDAAFASLELGVIQTAAFREATEDLSITFISGISLRVSPDDVYIEPDDTEWIFFLSEELAWDKKKNTLTIGSIHAT